MPGKPSPPTAAVDPHQAFDAVFFEDADEPLATLDSMNHGESSAKALGQQTADQGQAPVIQSNPFID